MKKENEENLAWKNNNTLSKTNKKLTEKHHVKSLSELADKLPWGDFTYDNDGDIVFPDYLDGESYEL